MMMLLIHIDLKDRGREHEVVNFLIEDGHANVRQACEIISNTRQTKHSFLKLGNYGCGGKLNNPILQAADLLAYGTCQYVSTGRSLMYQRVARNAQARQFLRLECTSEIIEKIKSEINASFERRHELHLREHLQK
jgi:hypothetical protein